MEEMEEMKTGAEEAEEIEKDKDAPSSLLEPRTDRAAGKRNHHPEECQGATKERICRWRRHG